MLINVSSCSETGHEDAGLTVVVDLLDDMDEQTDGSSSKVPQVGVLINRYQYQSIRDDHISNMTKISKTFGNDRFFFLHF